MSGIRNLVFFNRIYFMCAKWVDRKGEIHITVQQKSICEIFKKSPIRAKLTEE